MAKDWKDDLRPASFRGVAFFIESSQYTGGRRVTFHEFPDRDRPFPQDLGKVGKTFKVEGYLLGNSYFENKNLMIDAVDKFGPGELIHPYFGTQYVQCGAFSVDEESKEGAFCKLSFQFYEAGPNPYPKVVDNKKALVGDLTNAARAAAKGDFDDLFSIAKMPGFAVDTARAAVANAAILFQRATRGVTSTIEGIANLAYGIRNLKAEVNDLLQAPGKLSQRLLDSLNLLTDAVGTSRGKFNALATGFNFGSTTPAVVGTTPTRNKERDNQNAFNNFMKRALVAQAVDAAVDIDFTSIEEASAMRVKLRDLIDDILLNTESDEVFTAFKNLNAQLANVLPDSDSALPNIQSFKVEDTTSSLVLTYELSGDPSSEDDILQRNGVANPNFILAGTELEVLNVG